MLAFLLIKSMKVAHTQYFSHLEVGDTGSWTNDRVDLLYYGRIDYGRAHNSYN